MKNFIFFCELLPQNIIVGRPWFLANGIRKKGYKVYYFGLPPIFYRYWEEKKKVFQKFFDILKITHYQISGIDVYSIPIYFPRRYPFFHRLNYTLLFPNLIFDRFKKIFHNSIIFVNNLLWFWTLKKIDSSIPLIYDRADDLKVFYPYEKIRIYYEKLENIFLKKVKLTLVVSKNLKKEIEEKCPSSKILLLSNGVSDEWTLFSSRELKTNQLFKNIKKPIIGFIGSLFWWIDLNLIEKCLQNFPDFTFILIGPYKGDIKKLSKYSNILLLGPQPYSFIPYYINTFDVCLIPFKKDDVSYAADPVKLYEYLALGKPVVSTIEWQNDPYLKNLIYFASNEKEFVEKIKIALNENNKNISQQRKEYILKNHTWTKRVEVILKCIQNENWH